MNQWGRQPMGKDSRTLVLGIVIIGILGYLLLPNFFKAVNSSMDSTVASTGLNNVNQPSTYDPNALNSTSSPSQLFPNSNKSMAIGNGNGNNSISSGYWILFVSNGAVQQLSVNAQEYALIQGLIESDSRGNATITIFLIDNGQIHQFIVSSETYSIISNIATINARTSNSSTNYTPPSSPPTTTPPTIPTTTPTTTAISEMLTVSNPSTSGFTVALNPALSGLTISNFTLVNASGNPIALTNATTSVGGASYMINATLSAGQTYTLTAVDAGYTFGTAQNVVVPQ